MVKGDDMYKESRGEMRMYTGGIMERIEQGLHRREGDMIYGYDLRAK